MAFVVPVVMAFEAVAAAGSIAAAVSTIGGFLTVAGGFLAGVGAITGKKDLMNVGVLMSLGGGLANAATNAGSAGSQAAADEVYQGASESAVQSAGEMARAPAEAMQPLATEMPFPEGGLNATVQTPQGQTLGNPMTSRATEAAAPEASIMQRAAPPQTSPVGSTPAGPATAAQPTGPLAEAAASTTGNDVSRYLKIGWDKTADALSGAGQWVKNNKELAFLGGSMLNSMYGPEAEKMDLEKSILARRLRNLNSPVALGKMGG